MIDVDDFLHWFGETFYVKKGKRNMLIGKECANSNSFNLACSLVELDTNTEASEYITSEYNKLIKIIRSLGIKEDKAQDLLHDVYISIVESEQRGEGYDIEYGYKNGGNSLLLVEQFVIGRIKLYAKNDKYRVDIVESGTTTVEKVVVYEEPILGKSGYLKDAKGNILTRKVHSKEKEKLVIYTSAATANAGSDSGAENDSFQKAYANAKSADSIDDVTELYSIPEQINYCLDVCDLHGIKLINILKNLDILSSMVTDSKRRKLSDEIFEHLHSVVSNNEEFALALMSIINFSSKNRSAFSTIIEQY